MAEIYKPRKYQGYTTERIVNDSEVGALLDMGLGKTVATLTAIVELFKRKAIRKVLIIAPKRVAETVWTDEIEKWAHLNHLTTSQVLGTEKQRRQALAKEANIHIINRENVVWLVALLGSNWNFDMVVVDELSSFKSNKSQRFKSLKMVRRYIKRVVGLTGTPTPNGLLDLWAQMFLLDQGKSLGDSFTKYRDTYFDAGKRNGFTVFKYNLKKGDFLLGEDFYEKEILDRVGKVCFSMKTEDYIELPERIDNNIYVKLSSEAMAKYLAFEEEQVLKLAEQEVTAINAAALTNKLLQFANGAVYDEQKKFHVVHDEKLDALKEIFEDLDGKPVLVFYSFVHDKERILQTFKGHVRELKTPQDIKDWNAGKIKMLLAHPASAGHGLNLQFGGHNIVWFGCPWSLELYQQAVKRIHRSGVTHIVNNMRLIIRGTMDEDVVKALENKGELQDAVIHAVRARIEKYMRKR